MDLIAKSKAILSVSEALFAATEEERDLIVESARAMVKGTAPAKRGRPRKVKEQAIKEDLRIPTKHEHQALKEGIPL